LIFAAFGFGVKCFSVGEGRGTAAARVIVAKIDVEARITLLHSQEWWCYWWRLIELRSVAWL
jgi:hypothetical protein